MLDVSRGGLELQLEVDKAAGEPLGAEVSSALFDQVRTCDNHCEFCFIYQLPPGMRKSLYLKDDDYRLSFLYGNFTTLTRFTEADLERVVTERISPLHVWIHATDPEVRSDLLRNRRGATSLRWLRALLDHGIEVHGQIVVCPGRNDGAVLDDTLAGVLDRFPELASLCVVPLGISRYNTEEAMRPHTVEEAAAVVGCRPRLAGRLPRDPRPSPRVRRRRVLPARPRALPGSGGLRGLPDARGRRGHGPHLRARVHRAVAQPTGVATGFFAWVDGAPPEGYRAPRTADSTTSGSGCAPSSGPDGSTAVSLGAAQRARRHPHRGLRRRGARPARRRPRPRRRPGDPRREPVLRGEHRRRRPPRRPRPHPGPGRRAPRPPLPAARRLPVAGSVPRRHHARGTAPTGRGRGHRRHRPRAALEDR